MNDMARSSLIQGLAGPSSSLTIAKLLSLLIKRGDFYTVLRTTGHKNSSLKIT